MSTLPVAVTYRTATTDDLDAIMALETASFVADAWSRDMMGDEVESVHNAYSVALIGDALAGYAGLRVPRGAREADVQTIAVSPEARGRGIGRALMGRMIALARERGVREVFLEVRADNDVAQNLYRSLGFEELGVRPGYYQPEGIDAIVMRLALAAPSTVVGGETR
ncbi:MAG TPA: ribosomal protein S18-alanine N-acetyltransferase [Microbacteriaceae bacterium]|nr:ribosomal protein S18-alanine N-acetyltransferase [Microbacteriaceae bacterium]HQX35988.1 ribosomal protein S18-alanine N-acetyltransferase [Microbacteriaceae bacterium]HQZ47387.1 ribosomal protein S18-alanine N-acetyltransferase [Microbacteriaceae bacterium]HRA08551.1 ribosomal protein S18-alanine N-acetyltransferase [Microbacteriaceae bacterium]